MATEALVLERLATCGRDGAGVNVPSGLHRPRVELAGVLVDQLDFTTAANRLRSFLSSGSSHQVVTVNLDFLSIATRNAQFRATINQADLAVPDGMPLIWLARLRGQPLPERVAGVELVEESCKLAAQTGQGVFLLGAGPGVAERAAARLVERHPGLQVVGTYSPPIGKLSRKDNARIVRMIRQAQPGMLFVALGAPRQDLWIREHLDRLDVPIAIGVGCVFDLLAGVSTRAPLWMQHAGLEWAYRLAREPRRLWRRYLMNDLPLFARLLFATSRSDRAPTPTEAGAFS